MVEDVEATPRGVGWAIVSGDSMLPTLRPGDRVLVRYAAPPRPGQVVVARFPDGAIVIKRAESRRTCAGGEAGWWLASDNPDAGIDSRHRGVIADAAILGVVRLRVWPPRWL